jgi:acylphosphatase
MAKEERTIHFRGSVQGVGFRYTTSRIAGGYDIAGYVKNLPDGRVELVAEGESAEIDAFLGELRAAMGRHIRGESADSQPPGGKFTSFGIRH